MPCPRRAGYLTHWKIRVAFPKTLKNHPQIPRTSQKINQIKTVGSLGVLLQAKRAGLIACVAPLIEKIPASPVFMGESLMQTVLELAGESAERG